MRPDQMPRQPGREWDELDALPAGVREAFNMLSGVRIFVTSRERIKRPEGEDLFDESLETLRAELLRLAKENAELRERIAEAHRVEWRIFEGDQLALMPMKPPMVCNPGDVFALVKLEDGE